MVSLRVPRSSLVADGDGEPASHREVAELPAIIRCGGVALEYPELDAAFQLVHGRPEGAVLRPHVLLREAQERGGEGPACGIEELHHELARAGSQPGSGHAS